MSNPLKRSSSGNLTGTQATCANMHSLRGAVNNNLNLLDICLLLCKCTARNLRTCNSDLSAEEHILLANLTLSHGNTSYNIQAKRLLVSKCLEIISYESQVCNTFLKLQSASKNLLTVIILL